MCLWRFPKIKVPQKMFHVKKGCSILKYDKPSSYDFTIYGSPQIVYLWFSWLQNIAIHRRLLGMFEWDSMTLQGIFHMEVASWLHLGYLGSFTLAKSCKLMILMQLRKVFEHVWTISIYHHCQLHQPLTLKQCPCSPYRLKPTTGTTWLVPFTWPIIGEYVQQNPYVFGN